MSLQVSIQVPGMIRIDYPIIGQVISSTVKLTGVMFAPAPADLPAGTSFIAAQLTDQNQINQLTPSYQLKGKQYLLSVVTYYLDGQPFREVDFTLDEIQRWQFSNDYVPTVVASEEITPGQHSFTLVARFYSLQNPGVEIYDVVEVPFSYDATAVSLLPYINTVIPQQVVNEPDVKMTAAMIDYVLTQRTEGALKFDIDGIANLYDVDLLPPALVPYLAKTVGYDYFAGLLGNAPDALREELRYLPEWQKSAGTAASITGLLRPLMLGATITPLYLDVVNNYLLPGVDRRYSYADEYKIDALSKSARLDFPLTQQAGVVPNAVTINIVAGGLDVFDAVWDVTQNKLVVTRFHDGTGTPHVQWLVLGGGSNATAADVDKIVVNRDTSTVTIFFTQLVKVVVDLRVAVSYQYAVDSAPGRNTRLSEFFDIDITTAAKPNTFTAVDYGHIIDVVRRSKPLRTKLREINFPADYADAYAINADTVSTTGDLSNPDRINAQNIKVTEVQAGIKDSVTITHTKRVIDGFRFTWETDCDLWENRFGLYQSLALEPSDLTPEQAQLIASDDLLQRGYAFVVPDDSRNAISKRSLGLQELNFEEGRPIKRSFVQADYTAHYNTVRYDTPVSPAVQTFNDMMQVLDDPFAFSPSNVVTFILDLMTSIDLRNGIAVAWDGSSTISVKDLSNGIAVAESWDVDTLDFKQKVFGESWGEWTLSLYRFRTQADLDAFLQERPSLSNWAFNVGGSPDPMTWYAVWDATADFYLYPVHISTNYGFINLNHQGDTCCPTLGGVSDNTPFSFSRSLGAAYQNGCPVVTITNAQTREVVARYRWSGAYWITELEHPDITVSLSPAVSGTAWTLPMVLAGTVTYTGPVSVTTPATDDARFNASLWNDFLFDNEDNIPTVAGSPYTFLISACTKKVGDNLSLTPATSIQDSFSDRRVHNGELMPADTTQTWFGGLQALALFPLRHDLGNIEQVASEWYFRGGQTFPCVRMTVKPSPQTAFVYDSSAYDGGAFYDGIPGTPQVYQLLHFPTMIVAQTLPASSWDINTVTAYDPD